MFKHIQTATANYAGLGTDVSRYTEHEDKQHWARFLCLKVFKSPHAAERACPQCGASMVAMGLDFKAPSQRAAVQKETRDHA